MVKEIFIVSSKEGAKVVSARVLANDVREVLKKNNYANGKFLEPDTSFWPKKTYNKIINLNLLHSKKFLADAVGNEKAAGKKVDKIGKALRFYNKNYNDLLKDDLLSKFDGVTFKSNNRHNNLDVKDVESYLYSNS